MKINVPMVMFAQKVVELFKEEKVDAHVTGLVHDLLDQMYQWLIDGSPDHYMKFWLTIELDSRGLTTGLVVGTPTYKMAQIIRSLCQGILTRDAIIDPPIWAANLLGEILNLIGDVSLQELSAATGNTQILEEADAALVLVAFAQYRAATKLLKSLTQLLVFLKSDA